MINKLIEIQNKEGVLLVSSREVAENFEKEHYHVTKAIENKVENLTHGNLGVEISKLFIESQYEHKGNNYKEYLLTRDGFSFMAMGFTGSKADQWKLKYIEAFNKMEQELKTPKVLSPREELKLHYQIIGEQEEKITEIDNKVNEMENSMPLFNVECKELQSLVRKTGIKTLGGYRSPAYNDNSIRGKVYSDIQNQIKRQFGVTRYEAIKRIQLEKAKEIVSNYQAPFFLEELIEEIDKQLSL